MQETRSRRIDLTARLAAGTLSALLAACSSQPAPSGAAATDEARELHDAATMLDANSVSAGALSNDKDGQ